MPPSSLGVGVGSCISSPVSISAVMLSCRLCSFIPGPSDSFIFHRAPGPFCSLLHGRPCFAQFMGYSYSLRHIGQGKPHSPPPDSQPHSPPPCTRKLFIFGCELFFFAPGLFILARKLCTFAQESAAFAQELFTLTGELFNAPKGLFTTREPLSCAPELFTFSFTRELLPFAAVIWLR